MKEFFSHFPFRFSLDGVFFEIENLMNLIHLLTWLEEFILFSINWKTILKHLHNFMYSCEINIFFLLPQSSFFLCRFNPQYSNFLHACIFSQLWKKRKKKSIDERNLFLFRPGLWVGGDENSEAKIKYYFQKSLGFVQLWCLLGHDLTVFTDGKNLEKSTKFEPIIEMTVINNGLLRFEFKSKWIHSFFPCILQFRSFFSPLIMKLMEDCCEIFLFYFDVARRLSKYSWIHYWIYYYSWK